MRFQTERLDFVNDDQYDPKTHSALDKRVRMSDYLMTLSPDERKASGFSPKDLSDLELDIDDLKKDQINNEKQSTMDNLYFTTGQDFRNWAEAKNYLDSNVPKYHKDENGKVQEDLIGYADVFDRYNKKPVVTDRGSATLRQRSDVQDEPNSTIDKISLAVNKALDIPFLGSIATAKEEGLVPFSTMNNGTLAKEAALDALTWVPLAKASKIPGVKQVATKINPKLIPFINAGLIGAEAGANSNLTEENPGEDRSLPVDMGLGAVGGIVAAKLGRHLMPDEIGKSSDEVAYVPFKGGIESRENAAKEWDPNKLNSNPDYKDIDDVINGVDPALDTYARMTFTPEKYEEYILSKAGMRRGVKDVMSNQDKILREAADKQKVMSEEAYNNWMVNHKFKNNVNKSFPFIDAAVRQKILGATATVPKNYKRLANGYLEMND